MLVSVQMPQLSAAAPGGALLHSRYIQPHRPSGRPVLYPWLSHSQCMGITWLLPHPVLQWVLLLCSGTKLTQTPHGWCREPWKPSGVCMLRHPAFSSWMWSWAPADPVHLEVLCTALPETWPWCGMRTRTTLQAPPLFSSILLTLGGCLALVILSSSLYFVLCQGLDFWNSKAKNLSPVICVLLHYLSSGEWRQSFAQLSQICKEQGPNCSWKNVELYFLSKHKQHGQISAACNKMDFLPSEQP